MGRESSFKMELLLTCVQSSLIFEFDMSLVTEAFVIQFLKIQF